MNGHQSFDEEPPPFSPPSVRLGPAKREALLATLKARFEKHVKRHEGLAWNAVQARLEERPEIFIYHNGAQSYYAARGFRGVLRV